MYIISPEDRLQASDKAQAESHAYWARQEAYNYAQIFPERHRRQVAFTSEHLLSRLKPGDHVVDIGCADGWHSLVIAPHCARYVGYDYNPKFVELARASAAEQGVSHALFEVADAVTLELTPDSVDACVLSGLLTCMIDDAVAQKVLNKAAGALRPGGWVLLKDTLHRNDGVRLNLQEGYGASYRDVATYTKLSRNADIEFLASEWIDDGEEYGSLMVFARKAGTD